jgi:Domain of Unknown Function (DUF1080)
MSRSIGTFSLLVGGAFAVLLAASGCSSSSSDASGSGGSGGSFGSDGTATGNTGGAPGTGGAGASAQGGTTAAGGASAQGGVGTGVSADAGAASGNGAGGDAAAGTAGKGGAAGGSAGDSGGGFGGAGPVAGTTSIFDGKTLNGWVQGSPMLWSVVNGVIDGKGTTGGQLLMTQSDYGDFRIVVSSNMVAVGGTGHLGICFWGGRTPVGGYNDCKLIIPDARGDTWDYSLGTGLKGVTKVGTPTANPTWNTTEILCFLARGFCRVAMNGTAVLTYQEPNLKSIKAGPIGLQIHDGKNEEVQYKDVYVDPAPTVDQLLTVK